MRHPLGLSDPKTWVDRHGDVLFRYAVARLRNATLAEEAVQETFLAALQAREQPLEPEELEAREASAAFDGGAWRAADAPKDWGADARAVVTQQEFQAVLARCLGGLPARSAQAFTLREFDELPTDELCKVLNVSATNLWVMLHRARFLLRRCLETNWLSNRSAKPS